MSRWMSVDDWIKLKEGEVPSKPRNGYLLETTSLGVDGANEYKYQEERPSYGGNDLDMCCDPQ